MIRPGPSKPAPGISKTGDTPKPAKGVHRVDALKSEVVAELKAHPAAEIFPMMAGADFDQLVADIKANGQREPIIIHGHLILDGRNRHAACRQLGVKPKLEEWDEIGTPEAFVISMNLTRRHLSESQRAMVADKFATLKRGDNQHASKAATSQAEAANLLSVSRGSVQRALITDFNRRP